MSRAIRVSQACSRKTENKSACLAKGEQERTPGKRRVEGNALQQRVESGLRMLGKTPANLLDACVSVAV